jgi:uncharacterized membrane protein
MQVVAEFTPPEHLRPAELGLLLDERVDTLDVTSTIVDLAARGYVTIAELEKKWILGSQDYELRRTDKSDADLLAYERLLLSRLFADGTVVKLSSLKNSFYDDLAEVKKAVYENLKQRQYFVDDPSAVRTKYALIGLAIALVGGGLLWLALTQQFIWLAIIALAPLLAGLGTVVWSRAMAQRTALGSDVYRRALGYKEFIATAEKYRQQFFEKENLFNDVLPYAMMLGLTEKLANAMKQIGYQPSQPGWYSGHTAFNMAAFSHSMSTMSQAMNTAMATSPSSSGSGGGGSSGGGFGGGGGGSW